MNNSHFSHTRTPSASVEAGDLEETFNGVPVADLRGAELCRYTLELAKRVRVLEATQRAEAERRAKEALEEKLNELRSKPSLDTPEAAETSSDPITDPPVLNNEGTE